MSENAADKSKLADQRTALPSDMDIREWMVPMRDGTKLRTVACFPAGGGPWPTLITRTPYEFFNSYGKTMGAQYSGRGFVFVYQFCRGTGGSEGQWVPNENERQDGIDTVRWLAEQEWCKNIGIHGVSYMALTGWIIADSLPEKVKALYLCHYSVDRYLSAYKDGLFRHDVLTGWAMGNAGKKVTADYMESARFRPQINVDEEMWGIRLDWYRKWITSTDYSDEYWHTGVWKTLREIPEKIKVPVCVVAGWYDHHLEGTLLGFEKLPDPVKSKSKLVVGAWNHNFEPCVPAHHPKNAAVDMFAPMFDWFRRILVEEEEPDGGVEIYTVGDDRWDKRESWPVPYTCEETMFFTTQKPENSDVFLLDGREQPADGVVEYEYDPENPVPTHGGETLLTSEKERGSLLQQGPGYRKDVISFVSGTLEEDVNIAGKMNVKLFVSSDCEDTCFTARIMEVLPNGDAYNIRSTVTTLAYRNASPARLEYRPGETVEVNIELLPVTWNVKAGSRIRVDISSSSFPEYAIHSNYPGVWSLQDKTRVAHQRVFCGGVHLSSIRIPVIK